MKNRSNNFTKIDMSGINTANANCGTLLCENENSHDN